MRFHHLLAAAGLTGVAALASAAPALATFPGHNGRIVFGVPSDQGVQLHTVRPNGHDLRQITGVAGDAIQPDWSPDGRTFVFELDTEENANVAFIPADGGPIRVVPAPPGTFEGQPSYMPDGRHVLFTQFNGEEEATWIMKLDGSDRRRITAGPGDATDPNVAPDGRVFSYVGVHNHNWEVEQALVKSSLDGRSQLQLMPFDVEVAIKHDWAPDGSRIVFTNNADFVHEGESANVGTIRPDGTGIRYLTHYTGGEVNGFVGGYSPSGRRIVFRYEDHGRYALMTMRTDGTHLRTILPLSAFRPRFIDWGSR
jgi:Tol biopolymer transport system component